MANQRSNYEEEILRAMLARTHAEYQNPIPGGYPSEFINAQATDPANERILRRLGALDAELSAKENMTIPADKPRVTDPLDRARYPGS
jgi:hypothetical protein